MQEHSANSAVTCSTRSESRRGPQAGDGCCALSERTRRRAAWQTGANRLDATLTPRRHRIGVARYWRSVRTHPEWRHHDRHDRRCRRACRRPAGCHLGQRLRGWLSPAAGQGLSRSAALLGIADDEPQQRSGVAIDRSEPDRFGLPRLTVDHKYTGRDREAGDALAHCARRILHAAGAVACFSRTISTFSHALGTVRRGDDPSTAPLYAAGRYRGLDNLHVMDGGALPTSGGVNPSLTIAANTLRCATLLAAGTTRSTFHQETPHERFAQYRHAGLWPHRETA